MHLDVFLIIFCDLVYQFSSPSDYDSDVVSYLVSRPWSTIIQQLPSIVATDHHQPVAISTQGSYGFGLDDATQVMLKFNILTTVKFMGGYFFPAKIFIICAIFVAFYVQKLYPLNFYGNYTQTDNSQNRLTDIEDDPK